METSNIDGLDLLFTEIKGIPPNSTSRGLDDEEVTRNKLGDEEFLRRLYSSQGELKGVGLVKSVFALMDSLTAEYLKNNKTSCHKGCDICCHQLVCCTTLEMKVIKDYLETLPRPKRRAIKHNVKMGAIKFARSCNANKFDIMKGRGVGINDPLRQFYYGKPCPYLSNHSCSIYEARPADCRIFKTKDDCSKTGMVKEIRLLFEQISVNLIMEEEQKSHNIRGLPALVGWPLRDEFQKYFF